MITIYKIKIGDYVRSKYTSKVHKVLAVDTYWGWIRIDHESGKPKNITIAGNGNYTFDKLTKEELADHFLKRESLGLSSNWREYD